MNKSDKEVDFNVTVYYGDMDRLDVVETTLGELCAEYVEEYTTPYHIRVEGDALYDAVNKDEEVEIWKWGRRAVDSYKIKSVIKEEAQYELNLLIKEDMDNNKYSPSYYYKEAEAFESLIEVLEGNIEYLKRGLEEVATCA